MKKGLRLIVILMVGVFVGCGGSPAKVETANSNPHEASPAEAPAAEPAAVVDYKNAPQSIMTESDNSPFIEYQGWHGDKRRAWLTDTNTSNIGPIPRTDDPKWMERDPQGGISGPHVWLDHKFVDGGGWKMEIHASQFSGPPGPAAGQQITFEEEFVKYDGTGANKNKEFRFLDWENHPWRGRVPNLPGPYPAQPSFVLRRIH